MNRMLLSSTVLLRDIEKECGYWRRQLDTEYIKGILRGLSIAGLIVQDTIQKKRLFLTNATNIPKSMRIK